MKNKLIKTLKATKMVKALFITLLMFGVMCAHAATQQNQNGKTLYPIVLVHGLFGMSKIGPIDYFYGIGKALTEDGATVYVPEVSAANSTEVRGEQLLLEVKKILAVTGAGKVNLIGHSHGGPTVRYVASIRPDLVASVTSIGGVNKGTKVADMLLEIFKPGSKISSLAEPLFNGLGITISKLEGNPTLPQNVRNALNSLSTPGTLAFNKLHPWGVPTSDCGEGDYTANGVAYYSWTSVWKNSISTSFFNSFKSNANLFDLPLSTSSSIAFGKEDNDGLVGRCSSHLGKVIKDDYPMHHAHQINQAFGAKPSTVNPVQLYRDHANRLKTAGF